MYMCGIEMQVCWYSDVVLKGETLVLCDSTYTSSGWQGILSSGQVCFHY